MGLDMAVHALELVAPGSAFAFSMADHVPSLLLTFDRKAPGTNPALSPSVQLVEIRDDQGRVVPPPSFFPDFASDWLNWRLRFERPDLLATSNPGGIRSIDLTLAFPEERTFEFTVPSVGGR